MLSRMAARPAPAGHTLGSQVARRVLRPQGLWRAGRATWQPATLRAIARVQRWRRPALPLALRAAQPGYGEGGRAAVWRDVPLPPWSAVVPGIEGSPAAWAPALPAGALEQDRSPQPGEAPAPEPEPRRDAGYVVASPQRRAAAGAAESHSAPSGPRIQARPEAAQAAPVGPAPATMPAQPSPGVPAGPAAWPPPAAPAPPAPVPAGERPSATLGRPRGMPVVERRPLVVAARHLPLVSRAALVASVPQPAPVPRQQAQPQTAPAMRVPAAAGPLPPVPGEVEGVPQEPVQAWPRPGPAPLRVPRGVAGALAGRPLPTPAPLPVSRPRMAGTALPVQRTFGAAPGPALREPQVQLPPEAPPAQPRPTRGLPVRVGSGPEGDGPAPLPGTRAAGIVQARRELPLARPLAARSAASAQIEEQPAGTVQASRTANATVPHVDVVRRAADEATPAATAPAGAPPGRANLEPPAAPAVDLDTLARQVYEILRRRLRVERERGYGRSA